MNRRRMMMGGKKKPLIIFQYGNSRLSNGTLASQGSLGMGRASFKNGMLVLSSGYNANFDSSYYGHDRIFGIDFTGYKKLCFKVNVPDYAQYVGGGGDKIGIGYGPVGTNGSYEPKEWEGGQLYTRRGDYETELKLPIIKGECPINLVAEGVSTNIATGEYSFAVLNIYDIWLE